MMNTALYDRSKAFGLPYWSINVVLGTCAADVSAAKHLNVDKKSLHNNE